MSNEEIPYQVAPQVEALRQERANCVAYGNDVRVAAIDRQLAGLGVSEAPKERRTKEAGQTQAAEPPKGNASREEWATYAKARGATDEEVGPLEDGGFSRDDLRAEYGPQDGE